MVFNENERRLLDEFLSNRSDSLSDELLEKLEIGIWIFTPAVLQGLVFINPQVDIVPPDLSQEPLLLSGRLGKDFTRLMLMQFKEQILPYLMVRVESWQCYIYCNGEILSEHCDEDLDELRKACERLRQRCAGGHPPVMPKS